MLTFDSIVESIQDGSICPQCFASIQDGRCSANCDMMGEWDDLIEDYDYSETESF